MSYFDGKRILITGASSGIGKAFALQLGEYGAFVFLVARRKDRLEEVAKSINEKTPGTAAYYATDLSKRDNIDALYSVVHETLGKIDILINNAGWGKFGAFLEMPATIVEEMMATNFFAPIYLTQKVVPQMIQRKEGDIVNIVSLAGKNPVPNGSIYAATKHAMKGFFESFFGEIRQNNIRVINVYPGSVLTEFFDVADYQPQNRERILLPEDVVSITLCALTLPRRATVSAIDIRPTNP